MDIKLESQRWCLITVTWAILSYVANSKLAWNKEDNKEQELVKHSWPWKPTSVAPAFKRQKQEDWCKFKTDLVFIASARLAILSGGGGRN